jgi:hypothetical protein
MAWLELRTIFKNNEIFKYLSIERFVNEGKNLLTIDYKIEKGELNVNLRNNSDQIFIKYSLFHFL